MSFFLFTYLLAACVSLFATALARRVAVRANALDMPRAGRTHRRPVPRVGGLAIAGAIYATVLVMAAAFGDGVSSLRNSLAMGVSLMGGGLIVLLAGLADDLRGLKARYKLLAQIAAALLVCSAGIRVESLRLPGLFAVDLGAFSWPITVFIIVGVTNAFNLIDGMDGLAGALSAIACGVIAFIALWTGQGLLAMCMLAMLGALTGFMVFNFPPAVIFMGDCGSMFLGFMLAAATVLCARGTGTACGLVLPGIAMGVPILDTLFSIMRRLHHRRSPFAPDCGHVHHRLLGAGLSQRRALVLICGETLLAVAVAAAMLTTGGPRALCAAGGALLALMLIFFRAEQFPSDASSNMARKTLFLPQMDMHPVSKETLLRFREARTFNCWWDAVCQAAERLGFVKLSLRATSRNGSVRELVWQREDETPGAASVLRSVISVRHRRPGPPLEIEAHVPAEASLQAAGSRLEIFGRLVQKHDLHELNRHRKTA